MMDLFADLGMGALLAWGALPLLALAARPSGPREPASQCRALSLVVLLGASFFVVPLVRPFVHDDATKAPDLLARALAALQARTIATPIGMASPLALAGAFWGVIAIAAIARALLLCASVRHVIARAEPAPEPLVRRAERLARAWGLAPPRVVVSDDCATAFTAGLSRPTIVVPRALVEAFGPDDMELVFMHELSHVARGDLRANALLALPRALFALHPTARRLACEIRLARELAVDARVGALAPLAYPRMLIEAAHQARFGCPPYAIAMHRSDLGRRLAALSDGPPRARAGAGPLLVCASVLVLIGLAAPRYCVARAERSVSCSGH